MGLMMSNYNGHDRPFPSWFPYAVSGSMIAVAALLKVQGIL
jgi:hypothetical protein